MFDEDRKTCRERLRKHKERRKKSRDKRQQFATASCIAIADGNNNDNNNKSTARAGQLHDNHGVPSHGATIQQNALRSIYFPTATRTALTFPTTSPFGHDTNNYRHQHEHHAHKIVVAPPQSYPIHIKLSSSSLAPEIDTATCTLGISSPFPDKGERKETALIEHLDSDSAQSEELSIDEFITFLDSFDLGTRNEEDPEMKAVMDEPVVSLPTEAVPSMDGASLEMQRVSAAPVVTDPLADGPLVNIKLPTRVYYRIVLHVEERYA